MNVELKLPGADAKGRVFVTWTPIRAEVRLLNPTGSGPVKITLRNAGTGGRLRFATTRTHLGKPTLALTLPVDGTPVPFFVAGEFGRPSVALGDAIVAARGPGTAGSLGTKRVTVRIRKDAQTLTPAERDRFLAAIGTLNGGGSGRFRDFREMHLEETKREAHGNMGFLPWHRAYLLDLERELQAIDPSVALPYWRFDRPAPKLFTKQFLGVPNAAGRLQFTAGHPLNTWRTDGKLGISRVAPFPPNAAPPDVLTEAETIALGDFPAPVSYLNFIDMEGNPHGFAHTSFESGFIISIGTAARDPLFFLLHANVDRLWAKWQWVKKRTNPSDPLAFAPADPDRVGHRLADRMWPWNGVKTPPRPSTAPGGGLAPSRTTPAPGNKPTVRSTIDYQAVAGGDPLAFAYDDVPFEL